MSEKKTGAPAFPSKGGMFFYVPEHAEKDIKKAIEDLDRTFDGMTLRDYFAGQALIGMISRIPLDDQDPDAIARCAYWQADAMIQEREK